MINMLNKQHPKMNDSAVQYYRTEQKTSEPIFHVMMVELNKKKTEFKKKEENTMKREAFKMFLKPGFEKEYEKRHAAIWPELKKMLSDGGVYDYSIYWDKDTNILFACQKTKGDESSQDMGANPIVQNGGIIWRISWK